MPRSSTSSLDDLGKSDEDALKPEVPHEWGSDQVWPALTVNRQCLSSGNVNCRCTSFNKACVKLHAEESFSFRRFHNKWSLFLWVLVLVWTTWLWRSSFTSITPCIHALQLECAWICWWASYRAKRFNQDAVQNMVPAGPFLQYLGQEEGKWLGSVLIVLPPVKMHSEEKPLLTYSAGGEYSYICLHGS